MICVMVEAWVASGLRLPRSEVGRWPLSNWAMQFSHVPPLLILEYVTPLLLVCPCHYRVTCVLTLIGLRVVAIGSLEVLLSGLVDTSHFSVKYQSVPWHGTEVRSRPHDITDSYLLKMTLEPWSRLTSVVCSRTFGLAKHREIMTDGGGVMPTPECRNPNPYRMVCVVGLLCGGYYVWAHVTRFLQCPDLPVTSAFAPDLSHKCVLAYQRTLVHHL